MWVFLSPSLMPSDENKTLFVLQCSANGPANQPAFSLEELGTVGIQQKAWIVTTQCRPDSLLFLQIRLSSSLHVRCNDNNNNDNDYKRTKRKN